MPPRRRLLVNPATLPMPNFSSNGYAPSRARKRRQNNCSNEDAINMLQNEWTARNQLDIQRWERENPVLPDQNLVSLQHDLPPQETEGNLELLVNALQNSAPGAETLPGDQQEERNIDPHDTNANNHDVSHYDNVQSHSVIPQPEPQLRLSANPSAVADPQPQQQQQQQQTTDPSPGAPSSLSNRLSQSNDSLQAQLEMLLQQLHTNNRNPPFANPLPNPLPNIGSDQNSNPHPDDTSASSAASFSKVRLGRNVHDVMHNFHLLPLPVLEELRHMRHVKLWFFTNEGLEKTRLAKERTGRYSTSRVRFDFDKQGLVAENEYKATVKNAPEDNTLSPDQLNQAMPHYLDSIKHANWPADILNMFSRFFNEVQRHYKSRTRPIAVSND